MPTAERAQVDADFTAFVLACSPRLLHAADLLTGSRARAEDLVRHALAQAYVRWESLREWHPEASVRTTMLHFHLGGWRRARPRELLDPDAGQSIRVPDVAREVEHRETAKSALGRWAHRDCGDAAAPQPRAPWPPLSWARWPWLPSSSPAPLERLLRSSVVTTSHRSR